ncbi:CAMK/CAMKL protein kinase [Cryptococcus gattii E566]|uniref:CAMK/CAMKL protein kinase n=1 Tax=Cryptococcus gattii EJB2 TaxID=1296103 RepID=A0ABR5BQR1_9TREE|nr:CAMK/CAMKL protein kinase [Cryptococcus gattii EJB2]KIY36946.1 CAMK/CAMKL protein kinase [Cryptococcus gattii E566]KJE00584.1 CAMK/CAMKL protein kinase [Cryptococcus gattii NT-10]
MVPPARAHHHNATNAKQAQLSSAYHELANELGTENINVVGNYTLGRVIGQGTYGSVHLATHRLTGTRTAIKKVPKSFTPHLTRELHHHRRLHHPHIVHLHEIIATETHIWLVTELCSGGELFDYLVERGRILEGEARRLFGELTLAVGWMHMHGVVHRDLKLENVLLDGELRIKLGDLGFAREWQRGRLMDTYCGTTGYASPEMLACQKYLGVETDIWSLGIILYTLLCGGLPFDDDDERVMKELIQKGEYEEPDWLSDEARDLIRGMLQHDPSKRLSIREILTHPWFKLTIVDKVYPNGDVPSIPTSPNATSPTAAAAAASGATAAGDDFFESASRQQPRLTPHVAGPSPLSTHLPTTPRQDSASSDTANGRSQSQSQSQSTSKMARLNSAEFSTTEKELEQLHLCTSPAAAAAPRSVSSPSMRGKTLRTLPEGQVDVDDPNNAEGDDRLPFIDEHLHLPVALHSRTPSRTKRRLSLQTRSLGPTLQH